MDSQSSSRISSSSSKSYVEVSVPGEDLNREVQKLKDHNKQLVEHIHNLNGKVADTEIKLRHEKQKYDTYMKGESKITQEKIDMMATLVKENERKEQEIEFLRDRSMTQTKLIHSLENEVKVLKEDATVLDGELDQLRGNAEAKSYFEDQLNEQANELYFAKKEIEQLTERVQEIASIKSNRDDENNYMRKELERNRYDIQTLTNSVESLTDHIEQQKYEDIAFRESMLSKLDQKEEEERLFRMATLESLSKIQNNQTRRGHILPDLESSSHRQLYRNGIRKGNAIITKNIKANGNRFPFF